MKIPRSRCSIQFVVALAAVAALSPLSGIAQAPTATRPVAPVPPPARPLSVTPPAPRPVPSPTTTSQPAGPISGNLQDRAAPPPIQAQPPTQSPGALPAAPNDPAHRVGTAPARVYDRNGLPINGMEQVGPNRVRDPRTGRYYETRPLGDGQRIVP